MATIRNTSRYPSSQVRELVKFATSEIDMRHVHVNVKNSQHARRGMAYPYVPSISNAPPSALYLITIGIGDESKFPREEGYWNSKARAEGVARRGGSWPQVDIADWREQLVFTAAHEAKHIDQFRARARKSEVACDHFAAYVLRRYRTERLPVVA